MRKVTNEAGEELEIPDQKELDELKANSEKASRLEEELKTLTDKSAGLKNLREAINRKERKIGELEGQLKALNEKQALTKEEEAKKENIQNTLDDLDIDKRAENAARRVMLDSEINKILTNYSDEDRAKVKKYFDKLSQGEELNLDTMQVFLHEAERVAFPDRTTTRPTVGRPPRVDTQAKSFADTEDGQDLAKRLGFNIKAKE